MKKLLITAALIVNAFAITPYSLEGLKEVNVRVGGKSKAVSKEFKTKLKNEITKKLEKAGIKTKTENYSKFSVKFEVVKLKDNFVAYVSLYVTEDVIPARDKARENITIGITYKKTDMFDTTKKDLENDLLESAQYLVSEFLEQYKEENE